MKIKKEIHLDNDIKIIINGPWSHYNLQTITIADRYVQITIPVNDLKAAIEELTNG